MSEDTTPEDARRLMAAMEPVLQIPIAAEWREGVRQQLETTIRIARLVLEAPVDDREDMGPVFVPGEVAP